MLFFLFCQILHITDVELDESYLNRIIQDYNRTNDIDINLDITIDRKIDISGSTVYSLSISGGPLFIGDSIDFSKCKSSELSRCEILDCNLNLDIDGGINRLHQVKGIKKICIKHKCQYIITDSKEISDVCKSRDVRVYYINKIW